MRKYVITIFLLSLLDFSLSYYLNDLILSQNEYVYVYDKTPLIYLKKPIKLNNLSDFNFDEYFNALDFNDNSFKYYIDDENMLIILKNLKYNLNFNFSYEILKPEVITETKYVTETVYIENNSYIDSGLDEDDNHIYYSCDYYEFSLGTDISQIIETVQYDVECYTNVTCDYSCLNPYESGTYLIYFYNNYEKISKTIKII